MPHTINIGERINQLCARVGGKRRLAKIADISESQLHRIISGESQAKAETIAAIAAAAEAPLEWLMLGDQAADYHDLRAGTNDDASFFIIPSYGEDNDSLDIAIRKSCIHNYIGTDENDLVIALNEGDAMEPTLSDHGKLILDTSRVEDHQDGIYALRINDEFLIRRLQYNFDKSITILCDNPAYQAQTIPVEQASDLEIIGKAIWAGGKI